jgi:hypothetical protein
LKTIFIILLVAASLPGSAQGKFFGGNGDGFAAAALTNVVLPVEGSRFSGSRGTMGYAFDLYYQFADALSLLILEKSFDGMVFKPVDTVQVSFDMAYNGHAAFNDPLASAETIFYRVRIKTGTGGYKYSTMLSFRGGKSRNDFYFSVQDKQLYYTVTESGSIDIISSSGQLVRQLTLQKGTGTIQLLPLIKGIYLLRFQLGEPMKIVVQ